MSSLQKSIRTETALAILVAVLPFLSYSYGQVKMENGKYLVDIAAVPKTKWKFHTKSPVVASPIVSDGLAYFGSNDSVLYAVDTETGSARWQFKSQGPIRSSVAIEGNNLFLVGGDGKVYSIDKHSGRVRLTFTTGGEQLYKYYSYADYYFSSPVVNSGVMYFGSGDGSVYALKTGDGALLWQFKTGDVVHSSPVVFGEKVYVGSFDGYVYALHRQSGTMAWKFKSVGHRFFPEGEMQGSPVVANGLVYIGSRDYNLYALDTARGYSHWNKQFPKGWAMALSVRDSVLYVGTSDDDLLIAMDGKTGNEIWKTDVRFNIFGSPALTESMIYVGTLLGQLHGIDLLTGAIGWTFNTDGYTRHHAKYFKSESNITKDEFYAGISNPEAYIDALNSLGAIFSTPAVTDSLMIVSSTDGTVYCIEMR